MTYTKDELKKAISEKESQIRNLKLDQKEEELKVKNTAEIPGFPDRKSDDQRCGKEGWKCRKPVQRRKRLYPGQWKRRSVRARLLKRDVSRSGKSRR